MYIEPNTTIRLIRNCPLDLDYVHTYYFSSNFARDNYFDSLPGVTCTGCTYQREQRKIRVEVPMFQAYNCNYLYWENESYENNRFYAFITSVEYINNGCTEIGFEIDVMQTWFNLADIGECFVEREHSATDNIGDNTVPESLEQGEYTTAIGTRSGVLGKWKIVLAEAKKPENNKVITELYSGLAYQSFQLENYGAVNDYIQSLDSDGKADQIISIFMMPEQFVTEGEKAVIKNVTIPKWTTGFQGYFPKNNKLYTYPYNVLCANALDCGNAIYRYENFPGDNCTFAFVGNMSPNPQIICAPVDYNGVGAVDYSTELTLDGFPQCPWTSDTYTVWLAQNAGTMGLGLISTALSIPGMSVGATAAGMAAATPVGAAALGGAAIGAAVFSRVAPMLGEIDRMSKQPPTVKGNPGGSANYASEAKDVWFMRLTIKREYAMIIDEYFSMFGYATHRVKIPNYYLRPSWNYVKTIGASVHGMIPAEAGRKIESLLDRGITFWRSGKKIGDYSQDNSVSTGGGA